MLIIYSTNISRHTLINLHKAHIQTKISNIHGYIHVCLCIYIYIYILYIYIYGNVISCHECYIRFLITEPRGPQAQGRGDYKPDIARVGVI